MKEYLNNRNSLEWQLLDFFHQFSNRISDLLALTVSYLGSGQVAVAIIGIIYYGFNKKLGEQLAFVALSSMILNGLMKSLFLAKRPFEFPDKEYLRSFDVSKDGATGTSFPSGHSQNAGALYTSIFLNVHHKAIRILCLLFLVLVPLSRMILGVHFFGDVAAGLSLGILVAVVLQYVYPRLSKKAINMGLFYGILLIVLTPFLIINYHDSSNHDFFSSVGLLLGYIIGTYVEKRYVNFEIPKPLRLRLLQIIIGIIVVGLIYFGLSWLFKSVLNFDNNIGALIRYMIIAMVAFGFAPMLFIKTKGAKNV